MGRYGSWPAPKRATWKPASKLYLAEAVRRYGEHKIRGWNGSEEKARSGLDPPERPWLQFGSETERPNVLIFRDDGTGLYVQPEAAEEWWRSIAPTLVAEWRAERDAAKRWSEAISGLRNLLAEGALRADLLTKSGHVDEIPVKTWLAADAPQLFKTGYGSVHFEAAYSSSTVEGTVLVDQAQLDQVVQQTAADVSGAAVAIDKGREAVPDQRAEARPIDPERFPYLDFMFGVARAIMEEGNRPLKKEVEDVLRRRWLPKLGRPTAYKIRTMATFLRRPEDELGGNTPTGRSKRRPDK